MADSLKTPKLAAVIGWPVSHSLSPFLHKMWAEREGVDAFYAPIAVAPDYKSFERACDALRTLGYVGCNVTLPHKEHALRYASAAKGRARKAGAANMLTFSETGAEADNSDIAGFAAALHSAGDMQKGRAVVLGAGGAARAAVLALAETGFGPVVVSARDRAKGEAAAALSSRGAAIDWADREEAASGAAVLVNATPLGMVGQAPLDFDVDALDDEAVVAEIVYAPLETPLLRAARKRGLRNVDGLAMFIHQAAFAYRAWLGRRADADGAVREALEAELKRRGA